VDGWIGDKEMVVAVISMGGKDVPSSIPRPDLRMGTRDIDSGPIVVVVYSYPIGVFSYSNHQRRSQTAGLGRGIGGIYRRSVLRRRQAIRGRFNGYDEG